MKKQSFLFKQESVFKACIKALTKREFSIVDKDASVGRIQASSGSGIFEPKIMVEIHIEGTEDNTSSVNIRTKVVKQGLFSKKIDAFMEERFIDTLYKFISPRTSYFMEMNQLAANAA
jgi:predicted transcriptional regulator